MKKVVVKLTGGLGNQMFQYSAGRLYSDLTGKQLQFYTKDLLNHSEGAVNRYLDLDIFENIKLEITEDLPKIKFSDYNQIFKFGNNNEDIFLDGYFQSPIAITENNIKAFYLGRCKTKLAKNLQSTIQNNDLCINIRRGDYVSKPSSLACHGFLGQEYIDEAIKYFDNIRKVYVFSDEVDWCRENIKVDYPTVYVSNDYAGYKYFDYLRLMSSFDNMIIPNSTFAWWAAIFSNIRNNTSKVVCPAECLWYVNNIPLASRLLENLHWTKVKREDIK